MNNQITPNFSRSEFACQGKNCCGGSTPISLNLVKALQALRNSIGQSLTITSGFRCNKHNQTMRPPGAKNSLHCLGLAADIATPKGVGWTAAQLYNVAESLGVFDGIGLYDWGIHVDVRGTKARWDYRTTK